MNNANNTANAGNTNYASNTGMATETDNAKDTGNTALQSLQQYKHTSNAKYDRCSNAKQGDQSSNSYDNCLSCHKRTKIRHIPVHRLLCMAASVRLICLFQLYG